MSTLKVNAIRGTGASSDAISVNSTDGTCTAKITNNLSNRNLIIGGSMQIAQRGTSSTAEGYKTVDRWTYSSTSAAVFTTSQHALTSSDTGPWEKGFRYSWQFENGNQGTIAANSYVQPEHRIEAQDIANSGWNIADANSKITLSYWIKSSVAQTFYGFVETGDSPDWMYVFSTGALSANTWKKVTVTIPGNSNLAVNNDNGLGLLVAPWTVWGTDYTTSGRGTGWLAYASGNRTPDADASWWQTDDATLEITGVQLEVGDFATDFEHRSYGDELARCMRYFEGIYMGTGTALFKSHTYGSDKVASYDFKVEKRASPTIALAGNAAWNGATPTQYPSKTTTLMQHSSTDFFLGDANGDLCLTISSEL